MPYTHVQPQTPLHYLAGCLRKWRSGLGLQWTTAIAPWLSVGIVLVTAACFGEPEAPHFADPAVLHHIDVGQADATLIQAPDGTILIDAGHWQRADVVPYLEAADVKALDLLILTHSHADHIGQVPAVLDAFDVTEVWMTGREHETRTFERALDAVLASEAGYHEPRAGETQEFGGLAVEVIHPLEPLEDIHDNLAVRVVYGRFAAVYTGDAETAHELAMIERGHDLDADVLQLGHHGSRTSSSQAFLEAVAPAVAIYSAGADNQYGHPHDEVVERISGLNIELYGTDVHGTIVVTSDGRDYEVTVERSGEGEAADQTEREPAADCVDINRASVGRLREIVHIGPARAEQIIELRPFRNVSELDRVHGIGSARLDDIKDQGLACVR